MILGPTSIKKRNIVYPFSESNIIMEMSHGISYASYDMKLSRAVTVVEGYTVLASTFEELTLPEDVGAQVMDKSTWARFGIQVKNTWVDPGFRGFLTLELVYNPAIDQRDVDRELVFGKRQKYKIKMETPICQLVFFEVDEKSAYQGKYQNQPDEAVPALDSKGNEFDKSMPFQRKKMHTDFYQRPKK